MSKRTTLTRTVVTTLVVLGLSSGVAVANPCETDTGFAAANDCAPAADASVRVVSSGITAVSPAPTMAAGLGLRVR